MQICSLNITQGCPTLEGALHICIMVDVIDLRNHL
jgi:hypothetical protein